MILYIFEYLNKNYFTEYLQLFVSNRYQFMDIHLWISVICIVYIDVRFT